MSPTMLPRARMAGFSLIEVLIALLVLSLGLLGLAALQTATVRYNHGAYVRSQATGLAYSIVDRMRANREAVLEDGAYDGVAFADPAPACAAPAAGATMAESDINAWRSALACALPGGNGSIERNGTSITITVRWDESRGQASVAELETFAVSTGL